MTQQCATYEWTGRDKLVYFLVLLPFLVAFLGSAVLMATISVYWTLLLLLLYVLGCFFQAGCCVGCPYRGRWCPPIFGIFLANWLSAILYRDREFDQKSFNRNATLAASTVGVILVYCAYWVFTIHWIYVVLFFALGTAHVVLFFRYICPQCSYNETCPGGQIACRLRATG
jgi:hypothetical protein